MILIIGKVFSILAMVGIGFFLYRSGKLGDKACSDLTTLLLTVTAPCLSVYTLYEKELTAETIVSTAQAFFGSITYVAITSILAYGAVKLMKADKEDRACYVILMVGLNNGFMGFPVTKEIFGGDILYLVVIHNIFMNIYFYSIAAMQLNAGKGLRLKETAKSLLSPVMVFMFIGIAMLLMDLEPPELIDDMVRTLGDSTIPLSMIVVGLQLGKSNLKGILQNKTLLLTSVISMVVFPLLTFLIVNWLPLYTGAKIAIIFSSAFPSAVVPVALAEQYGRNAKLMAEGVTITTILSMITIPVTASLLTAWYY